MKRLICCLPLVILALTYSGCQSVRACKSGTVLLDVSFDSAAVKADQVLVALTLNGSTLHAHGSHTPGRAEGTVELDFAGSYPAGASVTLTVVASAAGDIVGTGSVGPVVLAPRCASLQVRVTASASGDAGSAGDASTSSDAGDSCPDGGCPVCGDGVVSGNEQCDHLGGADTAQCNGSSAGAVACQFSACGDGYANVAAGEQCDNGSSDSASCNGNSAAAVSAGAACQTARCGDGYVNGATTAPPGGEECDEGASNSNSGACLLGCSVPKCGDGTVESIVSEVCDDHNLNACGLCKNAFGCTAALNAATKTRTAAVGSMSAPSNVSFSDGETFTLSDGAHALTFEFDANGSVGANNVPIDIRVTANPTTMTCRICQVIVGSGLSITASGPGCPASSCSGTSIQLTNNVPSALGNVAITSTVAASTFLFAGMSGGATADCADGIGCTSNYDCASEVCTLNQTCAGGAVCGMCATPTCTDGTKNGSETDVDCGGTCPGCKTGGRCILASDCTSGVCSSSVYVTSGTGLCQ